MSFRAVAPSFVLWALLAPALVACAGALFF
jgi:hypothetical protein